MKPENAHPERRRSAWSLLLAAGFLVAMVVLIIPQETGDGGKYGRKFPDGRNPDNQAWAEILKQNTDSSIQPDPSSSDDSFRQLIASGIESARSAFGWQGQRFKSWSDARGLSGVICSVTTGNIPENREIVVVGGLLKKTEKSRCNLVCCYDANTGEILWEHQDGEFSDWKNLQVWVSLDMQGDVIIASRTTDSTTTAKLEKRSGLDGHLLWRMDLNNQTGRFFGAGWYFPDYNFPPSVDRSGNVWLLRSEGPGKLAEMYLSLLNGLNGELISSSLVAGKAPYLFSPKDFVCMEGGGAILFHYYGEARYVTRYSADGKQISQFPVTKTSGDHQPVGFRFFVDEGHQRIILCDEVKNDVGWDVGSDWESREVGVVALSMTNGTKLWDASIHVEGGWGNAQGYVPAIVVLLPKGDLEFRHEERVTKKRINWRKWTEYKGIPIPERIIEKKTHLLRTIMSGVDGSVGKSDVVESPESWFDVQLEESGSATKDIFDLSYRLYMEGTNRCRDSRSWLLTEEDGPGPPKRRCFRVVRCPSGRAVLTRDPQAFNPGYRENLWQVRSP